MTRLIEKLAEKKEVDRSIVANYVRAKLSFQLIRSQVACVRGARSLWKKIEIDPGEMEVVSAKARFDLE